MKVITEIEEALAEHIGRNIYCSFAACGSLHVSRSGEDQHCDTAAFLSLIV